MRRMDMRVPDNVFDRIAAAAKRAGLTMTAVVLRPWLGDDFTPDVKVQATSTVKPLVVGEVGTFAAPAPKAAVENNKAEAVRADRLEAARRALAEAERKTGAAAKPVEAEPADEMYESEFTREPFIDDWNQPRGRGRQK